VVEVGIMRRRRAISVVCLALASLVVPGAVTASTVPIPPTSGAVSVRSFGAVAGDSGDDTRAFQNAIAAASANRFRAGGPDGSPQGVVSVPAGTYRICAVQVKSNVRVEVDAGAVLLLGASGCANPSVFLLAGGVRNFSVVGVGSSTAAKPLAVDGRDLSHSFTINLNPAVTGATVQQKAISVRWVSDALLENVVTVQNDSRTADGKETSLTSKSPAMTFYGEPGSTAAAPRLPQRVRVDNVYNVRSPVSYGAVQMSACVDCDLLHVFSEGGVALRLETDAEEAYYIRTGKHYYSTVSNVRADDIHGYNGRQAMTFSPHSQVNGTVTATHVLSNSTYSAVRLANVKTSGLPLGSFSNDSSVTGVAVRPGLLAQIQFTGGWTTGSSWRAVDNSATSFTVRFANVDCGGLKSSTPCN
jgi:hypothetical protein